MLSSDFNPWNVSDIKDYSKLSNEFGISSFNEIISNIKDPNRYMRRNIIFGHRNFEYIINDINKNIQFAVVDGFMPTGPAHLGHKLVMDQIIWFQKHGGEVFINIADMEAYSIRGISWKKCFEIGINEYILNLIGLGLNPKKAQFYFQSKCSSIQKLTFDLGNNVNFSELSSIYGFSESTHLSHMTSVINQVSDILLPQLWKYYGPINVVVPVGSDQDPHIRLTRDLSKKMNLFSIESKVTNNYKYWSIRNKKAPIELFNEIKIELSKLNLNIKVSKMHIDIFNDIKYEVLHNIIKNIVKKYDYYYFNEPSSIYHKFMSGLNGGKMSSSKPETHISMRENENDLTNKIKKAITGGRQTIIDQRLNGGNPNNCVIYELFLYHIYKNDKDVLEHYNNCKNGYILCGSCKSNAIEYFKKFLKDHLERKEDARKNLDLYNFL